MTSNSTKNDHTSSSSNASPILDDDKTSTATANITTTSTSTTATPHPNDANHNPTMVSKEQDHPTTTNENKESALESSPAPAERTPSSSTSSSSPQISMCLAPCHRFHTNPAVSSPKHFIQSLTVTNPFAPNTSSTTNTLTNHNHHRNHSHSHSHNNNNTYHSFNNSNSLHSVQHNTKAMKRKQRLAQYKAQSSEQGSNPNAVSNDTTSSHPPTSLDGSSKEYNHNNHPSSHHNHHPSNEITSSCHVKWAPNKNYIKNVELVAIASPLTSHDAHHPHLHTFSYPSNSSTPNPVTAAVNSVTNASTVFVLVFDEGIFSHNGDFSLSSELCDLFGLPTQNLLQARYEEQRGEVIGKGRRREGVTHGGYDAMEEEENGVKYGLRRRVFRDPRKHNQTHTSSSMNPNPETHDTSSTPKTHLEKLKASIQNASKNVIQPLLKHISHEIENSIQILKSEVIGDGRIHNPSPKTHEDAKRDDHSTSHMKEECKANATATTTSTNNHYQTTNGGTKECPIKPTLVFRINLPYSTTSMEIMNMDWNADGTSLCIVQRRKGFSASTGSSTVSGGNAHHNHTTNKKKKHSNHNTPNANYHTNQTTTHPSSNPPPISPGNTAVSFWCIPPWLQSDYEDHPSSSHTPTPLHLHNPIDMHEDRLLLKANNTSHECGWEMEDNEQERSLFPLWEWYLQRYVFQEEVMVGREWMGREGLRTRIMMKNRMDQTAYAMELAVSHHSHTSGNSGNHGSVSGGRHGKKSTSRGGRGGNGASVENINAMMNGDVTCLFWEESTPEDEKRLGPDAYKEKIGNEYDHLLENGDAHEHENEEGKEGSNQENQEEENLVAPSKWIAIGTSKGQIILHNSAASFLSNYSRNTKPTTNHSTTDNTTTSDNHNHDNTNINTAANLLASMSTPSRTVTIPIRHKKRVTCGSWVDHLLVFGYVGTGCLTLVSTFPKLQPRIPPNDGSLSQIRYQQDVLDPLFTEKTIKVLGNIMLPGGRDAVNITMGNIQYENTSMTILAVNCEEKCLLFYTFPKIQQDSNSTKAAEITSSPAMEVSIHLSKRPKVMDVMYHTIIPNSYLAIVALKAGYVALVDWASGVIVSDVDVSNLGDGRAGSENGSENDVSLMDIAFHLPSCTAACLTSQNVVVIYHVRIRDQEDWNDNDNNHNQTILTCKSKKHTRPKTKSSSSPTTDEFVDKSTMNLTGTISLLCTRQLPHPKGVKIQFSADGDSVSVSLGDESVSIFSIKTEDEESKDIKERLAKKIFWCSPYQVGLVLTILNLICVVRILMVHFHQYQMDGL